MCILINISNTPVVCVRSSTPQTACQLLEENPAKIDEDSTTSNSDSSLDIPSPSPLFSTTYAADSSIGEDASPPPAVPVLSSTNVYARCQGVRTIHQVLELIANAVKANASEIPLYQMLVQNPHPDFIPLGVAKILSLVAKIRSSRVETSEKKKRAPGSIFQSPEPSSSSLDLLLFVNKINMYLCCSKEAYVLALIYIDRITSAKNRGRTDLNIFTVRRLLLTAIVVATKYWDDECFENKFCAKVGGVSEKILCGMEMEFVELLDWKMCVSESEFRSCMDPIILCNAIFR